MGADAVTHLLAHTHMKMLLNGLVIESKTVIDWFRGEPTLLLTFLCLADRSSLRRGIRYCWPSLAKIQQDTGLSVNTVKRSLKALESKGLIERSWMQGSGYKSKVTVIKV